MELTTILRLRNACIAVDLFLAGLVLGAWLY